MRDPVGKGRAQILTVDSSFAGQAVMVMGEMQRLAELDPEWDWSKTAVIARQWQILHPILAFCEANGIPAQRADREPPQFWRLRETQNLASWLSERGVRPVTSDELDGWFAAQPRGRWYDLLADAAMNYRLECGDGPLPGAHFREWLAEWGREIRQKQNGMLLLTAHRVKGLEFDHVGVLDGAWEDRDAGEDPDAARRLFYVAMTRARKTLTLARMKNRHKLIDSLPTLSSVLRREAPAIASLPPELNRCYEVLTPGDVDLGFAGRQPSGAPIHRALASLQPETSLQLMHADDRWYLEYQGRVVGRLANNYAMCKGMRCIDARAHAVLVRLRTDGDQAYASSVRCDHWEVVIPELVFAPCENR
jgi:ATP-dependent DNA helicase RecQ